MSKNRDLNIQIPDKLLPLWTTDKRYIVLKGGRGSAKSWGVADYLIIKGFQSPKRILCTREIQKSIKDSVHKLLVDTIFKHGLQSFYHITDTSIKGSNGTEFIFKGLRHNISEIKSTEGIDICWVEEGEDTSRTSIDILTPTIRKDGSQIIFVYNPKNDTDPIHVDFALAEREDTLVIELNHRDNKWFPEVLKKELEFDKERDYDKYLWKWEGQTLKHSEAQVYYGKWSVEDFDTPEDATFNYGLDFGYSSDPTAGVRNYIQDDVLYIDYECWGLHIELDDIPNLLSTVPLYNKNQWVADNSRPETISHLNKKGLSVTGCKKGKGSIIEGIEKIRSFKKIIIHPRCKKTIEEFQNYKWKVDKITNEISTTPEDKSNHIQDALRYSLEDKFHFIAIGADGVQSASGKLLNDLMGNNLFR